jgi:hypothetical protein
MQLPEKSRCTDICSNCFGLVGCFTALQHIKASRATRGIHHSVSPLVILYDRQDSTVGLFCNPDPTCGTLRLIPDCLVDSPSITQLPRRTSSTAVRSIDLYFVRHFHPAGNVTSTTRCFHRSSNVFFIALPSATRAVISAFKCKCHCTINKYTHSQH